MDLKDNSFAKKRSTVFVVLLIVFCFFLMFSAFADGFNFWSPWSTDFNSRVIHIKSDGNIETTSIVSHELHPDFKAVRFAFGLVIVLFISVIAVLMNWELSNSIFKNYEKLNLSLSLLSGIMVSGGMIPTFFVIYFREWNATVNWIWTASLAGMIVFLWAVYMISTSFIKIRPSLQVIYSIGAVICFIACIGTIYFSVIRGWTTIFLLIAIGVCTDTFAYLFGKRFGKNPLIKISPSKTWEGAFFGVTGTVLTISIICVLYSIPNYVRQPSIKDASKTALQTPQNYDVHNLITNVFLISFISGGSTFYIYWWVSTLALIFTASIFAIGGDLFFSYIKRLTKIKDFSKLLGKHGGILDRFDSSSFLISFFFIYHVIAGISSNQRLLMEPNTYFSAVS
ncbi:phosphatidate cytidylyltransferase [Mycoplasmoides pneumoniae]